MSPQDTALIVSIWLAALGVLGGSFAVPRWLRPFMIVLLLALAAWGTMAVLWTPAGANRKTADFLDSFEGTPAPASTPVAPLPKMSPTPAPTPSPTPRPTAVEIRKALPLLTPSPAMPEESYYPEPTATPEYYDVYVDDEPDTTAEDAPYIANFVNTTATTLSLEHLFGNEWLPFKIPPGETTLIGSIALPMRLRPCDCYYRDWESAVPEWSVDASEAGKPAPIKRFEFYTDKRGKIDLRSVRR